MIKMKIEGEHRGWRNEAGQYHRVDGPACIFPNGTQVWLIDGKCHRLDGPAVIDADGTQSWLINNIEITREVYEWMDEMSIEQDYIKWTDKEKMWFKLRFCGIST